MLKSGETCPRCGVIKLSEDGVCSYCSELVYTQADLDKAISDEREACAQECLMLDGARLDDSFTDALEMCAEAIRNRGKELIDE